MHFKEKDALLGEIRTLRRKMHFKEKDALYGERPTLRRKMHFKEKEENNTVRSVCKSKCFQVTIFLC